MKKIERIAERIIEESNEAYDQHKHGCRIDSYRDILSRHIEDALRVERERCDMLAEYVADIVEDLNFYVSCTPCEDNSTIRDKIVEKLKPFLKGTK